MCLAYTANRMARPSSISTVGNKTLSHFSSASATAGRVATNFAAATRPATKTRNTTQYTAISAGEDVVNTGKYTPILSPPLAKVTPATAAILSFFPETSSSSSPRKASQAAQIPMAKGISPKKRIQSSGRMALSPRPSATETARFPKIPGTGPKGWLWSCPSCPRHGQRIAREQRYRRYW